MLLLERPDGIVLRTATPDDVEEIVAMSVEAHGAKHEWGFRTVMADPTAGLDRWVVATDPAVGHRIVSTLCLMQETFVLDGVEIPVGRPEYVATLPDYRRRRLIRDQLDVVHRWSEDRGDLAQMILGIAYFYRRFGYEYGADYLRFCTVTSSVPWPEGWTVRRATADDIGELRRLRDLSAEAAGLSLVYTDRHWQQFVDDDPLHVIHAMVAEGPGGSAAAYVLQEKEDEPVRMAQVGADALDGVRALVAWGAAQANGAGVAVADRPNTPCGAFVLDHTRPAPKASSAYIRVADPVAFLDRIRPALSARLAASPHRNERGELTISLYATGIRIAYDCGQVTAVERCEGIEEPLDAGAAGVAPDQIATLLLGRHGALEQERRTQDVDLGVNRSLMAALFPPLVADLATAI